MSVFNKAGANPRLFFKAMVSPAAAMILLLGLGWKPDPGEGKAEIMGFLIVSQSELPVPNCSGFGGSTASTAACRGAGTGRGTWVRSLQAFFFLFNLQCAKWLWGFVPLCHITSSCAATAKRLLCIISSEIISTALAQCHFSSGLQRAAQNKGEEGSVMGGSGMDAGGGHLGDTLDPCPCTSSGSFRRSRCPPP